MITGTEVEVHTDKFEGRGESLGISDHSLEEISFRFLDKGHIEPADHFPVGVIVISAFSEPSADGDDFSVDASEHIDDGIIALFTNSSVTMGIFIDNLLFDEESRLDILVLFLETGTICLIPLVEFLDHYGDLFRSIFRPRLRPILEVYVPFGCVSCLDDPVWTQIFGAKIIGRCKNANYGSHQNFTPTYLSNNLLSEEFIDEGCVKLPEILLIYLHFFVEG